MGGCDDMRGIMEIQAGIPSNYGFRLSGEVSADGYGEGRRSELGEVFIMSGGIPN